MSPTQMTKCQPSSATCLEHWREGDIRNGTRTSTQALQYGICCPRHNFRPLPSHPTTRDFAENTISCNVSYFEFYNVLCLFLFMCLLHYDCGMIFICFSSYFFSSKVFYCIKNHVTNETIIAILSVQLSNIFTLMCNRSPSYFFSD